MNQGDAKRHLGAARTREGLADCEELLVLSSKSVMLGDEAAAETHPLTVVSSIHGTRPPSSTNLLRRIWKCTGGPPNDVNPKSQKLTATSRSRGSSLLVLAWYAPGRSSPALRRKLKMAESGIIAERGARSGGFAIYKYNWRG